MSSSASTPNGEVVVHVFGRTDVGRTREHNEDAFVVADLSTDNATLQPEVRTHTAGPKGTLFLVADGMGGAAAGEIASAMAVEIILDELRTGWIARSNDDAGAEAFVRAIKQATKTANEQINGYASSHPEFRGMGTTATIAGLLGDTLYLAQVGDSRAYIVRDGVARQITKDQSLMQKLVEAGELTEEEAEHSERRNIILQALGPEAVVKIDLTHQTIRRGDVLVLCSDGLSGQVTKDEIAAVVSAEPDLTTACRLLIDRANEAGGPDNITVIVARFDGDGLRPPARSGAGETQADAVGHRVFPLPDTGQQAAIPHPPDSGTEGPIGSSSVLRPAPRATLAGEVLEATAHAPLQPWMSDANGMAPEMDADLVNVSAARRSLGRLIAVALLALFLVGAAWFVIHSTRAVTDLKNSGTAPTSTKRP
jgi:protein phosphatase